MQDQHVQDGVSLMIHRVWIGLAGYRTGPPVELPI